MVAIDIVRDVDGVTSVLGRLIWSMVRRIIHVKVHYEVNVVLVCPSIDAIQTEGDVTRCACVVNTWLALLFNTAPPLKSSCDALLVFNKFLYILLFLIKIPLEAPVP